MTRTIAKLPNAVNKEYNVGYEIQPPPAHYGEAVMQCEWSVSEAVELAALEDGATVVIYEETSQKGCKVFGGVVCLG